MARPASFYTDRALAALNAGFTSMAGQKAALSDLNYAYDVHKRAIADTLLADRDIANWDDLYYGRPDLHNWKPKHSVAYAWSAEVPAIEQLVELRATIKAAPVNSPVRAEPSPYQVRAEKTLSELIELRQSQYLNAINLGEVFNGLPVHANTHRVTNDCGTTFLRTFYYLAGRFTPLSVIIAAAEELERRKAA